METKQITFEQLQNTFVAGIHVGMLIQSGFDIDRPADAAIVARLVQLIWEKM